MKTISAPSANFSKRARCQACPTTVEVGLGDLTYVGDPRDGDAVKWTCPTCGRENYTGIAFVPAHLRGRLK